MSKVAALRTQAALDDEFVHRRSPITGWMTAHPVASYFMLAYGISWTVWTPLVIFRRTDALSNILLLAGGFGPPLAALLVSGVIGGSAAVRQWAGRIVRWKVGTAWWLVALLGIPLIVFIGFAAFELMGGHAVENWRAVPWYSYALTFAFMFFFGGGEEPGWRGFALPRLQARYGALTASLIIGLLWPCWHLPLFFSPAWGQAPQFIWFAASLAAFSVILTWLFNSTGGSVLLVMVMHASVNAVTNPPPVPVSSTDQGGAFMAALALVAWIAALALAVFFGPARLSRRAVMLR